MPLRRSESQGGGDIEAVLRLYRGRDGDPDYINERNSRMRSLLKRLNDELPETTVWGLTSLDRLWLMSNPQYDGGPCYVGIDSMCDTTFQVTYSPPDGELPIPNSEVVFRVVSIHDASEQIRFAMFLTGGWPQSLDLHGKSTG